MKAYTQPALAAVYGVVSEQKGVLIGSGTFLRLCGRTYLPTAEHVVTEGKKYATIAHTSSSGSKPEQFKFGFRTAVFPLDLAIGRIDDDVVREHGIVPWGVDALGVSSSDIERDVLFVHGYPADKSGWVPIVNGGIHSTSMPFWTTDGEANWNQFDPNFHFAILYPENGWFDENGKPVKATDPSGLSGSAVWQTNRRGTTGAAWATSQGRIVGVVFFSNGPAEVLIATRIETVREFLLEAIRQERAYELWEARGRPLWDVVIGMRKENRIGN